VYKHQKMKNLIIIGNGFDLAHGLKSNYADFTSHLRTTLSDYQFSQNHLLLSMLNNHHELWSDIESAYFDIISNFGDKKYLMVNYANVNLYKSIKELNEDFEKIKELLQDYLLKIKKEFIPIENYINLFKEFNNTDAVVINFNYTKTVKHYINNTDIKLIQIHGELKSQSNPIIFGFAANNQESKKLLSQNNNHFVRNIKKFNYLFTINEATLKEHLKSEEYNVYILGHSCGISDELILSDIFNSPNIHKIIPFYFRDRDGYFNTMVNIDRIIDDYSKGNSTIKVFRKLNSFPDSYIMPQIEKNEGLLKYLKSILSEKLPKEKKQDEISKGYGNYDSYNK
jgi:hypothetical protein